MSTSISSGIGNLPFVSQIFISLIPKIPCACRVNDLGLHDNEQSPSDLFVYYILLINWLILRVQSCYINIDIN